MDEEEAAEAAILFCRLEAELAGVSTEAAFPQDGVPEASSLEPLSELRRRLDALEERLRSP